MRTRTDVMMIQQKQKSVLLIAGPTASGKSALAVALAKERDGVVINADASQVYREIRILSARPTDDEMQDQPHRLYGHKSGGDDYSVADWLKDVEVTIEETWGENKLPIIVGGTGLYFMALERGLAKVPPIGVDVREKWRQFTGDLHAELHMRDAEGAAKLNKADRQRLIRALEVVDGTGRTLSAWQQLAEQTSFLKNTKVERIFKTLQREELYDRANSRFSKMLDLGALNEVRSLPNFDPAKPIMKAIGIPELQRHIRGEITLEEATILAQTATRHYIKRQMTWFRGKMKDWDVG
jgi:tRNA dimethylallyltransferase